ncbi:HTH domain-containing protein [Flavobacterium sp. NST-5]|uniref:HTH domain-containing protein n=1 Tax=Flavobacterium ichthyis TaxID=2698827 RepID=A0ABW9Z4U8_9FLAO|nr:HTH domain-containing protein [Flavobacterium ichthyis]
MDIRIIIKLHELISTERTGNPKACAEKLNISERTIYNYVSFMRRELKAPIIFNVIKGCYCYDGECKLRFRG